MPPKSEKKDFWSGFLSLFGGRCGRSTGDRHRDSRRIASAAPTRSVPDVSLPLDDSTPQSHGYQPPIRESRRENNVVESSQSAELSVPGNRDLLPQPPHQLHPTLPPDDNPAVPRVHGGTKTFLAGASGFRMGDMNYYEGCQVSVNTEGGSGDRSIDGWALLLKNIAPNALHDSNARYDAPKCDEDTRVEVIDEIMERIQDSDAPQRLLCMTGAAGSGKSALQQTIAERCSESDILSAAFFLSSTDPTRNNISFIVPTIAYQIGLKHHLFQSSVAAAVKHDPYIFSRSLRSQMDVLIVRPFESVRRSQQISSNTFPYAILIDGLDECNGAPNTASGITPGIAPVNVDDRRRAEDQQEELLAAIKHCILDNDLPFRVFIASRPEWAIHTALEPGGLLREAAYHIQLSHKYDASEDMRRYLRRRLEDIGLRIRNPKWFSEGDIETLVGAVSGQFIYVATAYKYISERRASPEKMLKIILTWTPHEGQATRPFEALDRLYTNILLAAKNAYEAVESHHGRDFLLLFKAHHMGVTGFHYYALSGNPAADLLSALLCLEARAKETLISDLRSLVALKTDGDGDLRLRLYHKSFSDFLQEPSRAKDLFVPEDRVYTHLASCFMQHIIECPLDFDSLPAKWEELPLLKLYRDSLKEAVEDLPSFLNSAPAIDDEEVVGFTQNGGWQKINNLLPLLYFVHTQFYGGDSWMGALRNFTGCLEARKTEAAAVISAFVEKWKNDFKQYNAERRRKRNKDSDSI
ncbi:hypothetical protein EST38_g12188 [Candolleomyces aberdarensis]|uniref:Nephrocystin 3-like N-terminal domain-containing protein n=1 Tax=Candolleomyces aberdarensis TaxID=2316362 RepID=A0A4Q2D554_9AGAR|nr:hypothetical protein EST38_g12188 [Candolleomyces aberdarensis]